MLVVVVDVVEEVVLEVVELDPPCQELNFCPLICHPQDSEEFGCW
ncbi:hypothetical protein [Saccharopolyspora antimicrobica]|nr:hypothetical protein [Saccharopolyspora antimicrobica]